MREPTDEEYRWWQSLRRLFGRKPEGIALFVDGYDLIAVDALAHRTKAVDLIDRIEELKSIHSQDIGSGML